MTDWTAYLESICRTYAQWWQVYTLTDVVGQVRETAKTANPSIPLLDLGLMVETIEQIREEDKFKREEGEAGQEEREADQKRKKTERLDVLGGLRKYASDHVLLVRRPGSGKSTALVRLLLEEAERGRSAEEQGSEGFYPCVGRNCDITRLRCWI